MSEEESAVELTSKERVSQIPAQVGRRRKQRETEMEPRGKGTYLDYFWKRKEEDEMIPSDFQCEANLGLNGWTGWRKHQSLLPSFGASFALFMLWFYIYSRSSSAVANHSCILLYYNISLLPIRSDLLRLPLQMQHHHLSILNRAIMANLFRIPAIFNPITL